MIQNLRDLGGIRTRTGAVIRPGMLIRSALLSQAEESDLAGISSVIDLRTPGERKHEPDLVYGREYLPLPVFDDETAGISHESGPGSQVFPDLALLYGRLMRECAASFRKVLLTVMRHDFSRGAVLWHCTEGKDRCGMTAALILEALEVDREIILEDYLKTNLVNRPKALRLRERLTGTHGREFADSVFQAYLADERYIRSAWEAMGTDYIHDQLGIGGDLLDSFRRSVLTAPDT